MKMKKVLMFLLCLVMMLTMAACQTQSNKAVYKSGTYTASANGKNGAVKVEVVFTNDKIKSVKVVQNNETSDIGGQAIKTIADKIVSGQTLAVDAESGATTTSNAILEAVANCVKQAGGNTDALKSKKTSEASPKTEEVNYDIVVVRAGVAGTAAALSASEKSHSVLLLEKTATPMGAGTLAGGLFAAESSLNLHQVI
jgi:fumarate reductase flavoprotein subunit